MTPSHAIRLVLPVEQVQSLQPSGAGGAATADWDRNFLRNLAVLTQSGVTLHRALTLLTQSELDPARAAQLKSLYHSIHEGEEISVGLSRAGLLGRFERAMVKVGERVGGLASVTAMLADYREKTSALEQRVRKSLTYPLFVLGLCLLFLVVVPPYLLQSQLELIRSTAAEVPLLTVILFKLSAVLSSPIFWACLPPLLYGGAVFTQHLLANRDFRLRLTRFCLTTPLGKLYRLLVATRYTRALALGLKVGLPIQQNLRLANEAGNSVLLESLADQIERDVLRGADLSQALRATGVFPESALSLLAVGEECGKTPEMAARGADMMESDLETTINSLVILLEPAALLLMGLMVGTFALGVMLPTANLLTLI